MYLGIVVLFCMYLEKKYIKKKFFSVKSTLESWTQKGTHTQLAENMAAVPSSKGLSPHCCSDT